MVSLGGTSSQEGTESLELELLGDPLDLPDQLDQMDLLDLLEVTELLDLLDQLDL